MTELNVPYPCTVYIHFSDALPNLFVLTNGRDEVEFFRRLDGHTPRIKFNMPDAGRFTGNTDFRVEKISPIEIPPFLPTLPPPERDRWIDNPEFIYDPEHTISPASNYTMDGVIVHGPAFMDFPRPIRVFIDLHELGHFFYCTEEYCDLYAFVNFLRMGYNRSTAYYALSDVLHRSSQGIDRVNKMMKSILDATGNFKPY